jgi:hypothetical protein
MTPIELSRSLIGKVSTEERYFRIIVSNLIKDRKFRILYREKTFSIHIVETMGEDQGSEQFNFLMRRRDEYMVTVEDIILKQLRVV